MLFDFIRKKRQTGRKAIHLDYASTTPVRRAVLEAMMPYFSDVWANPSSIYKDGVQARNAVDEARTTVARLLHIRPHDVIFTSGGTESNNLAIFGVADAQHAEGCSYGDMEVISTRIEHPSILESLAVLEQRGVRIVYLDVHEDGRIDTATLERSLTHRTVLVSLAYANSEIGVVQDIKRITRTVRAWNTSESRNVLTHIDASQAPLWLPCALDMLGADLMTLDAGKCYGPKGVGVLAMRHGVTLAPQIHGGGQERKLRSGTENTPLIVGCAEALTYAQESWKSRGEAVASLRDFMWSEIMRAIPAAVVNGSIEHRIANNINISIPGIDTEFAVIALDAARINASTRSACGSSGNTGSSVVREITRNEDRARSTIRFTLGEESTRNDIVTAIAVLKAHVEKMQKATQTLRV